MDVPDGYEVRPPTPDDLAPVADILVADQLDGGGDTALGADFIREVWSRLGYRSAS